jgi:pimeloyl-ACP methyl ester carboxylesterase
MSEVTVAVESGRLALAGDLEVPSNAKGIVVFAHGSGSSRFSPRNQAVARSLREAGFGTLLFDLLSPEEERKDWVTAEFRFDIPLLARRLEDVVAWVAQRDEAEGAAIGCFGASTGAAAALIAAADAPDLVASVVSRGGRPDLAGEALPRVRAPTLLIVGGRDTAVIGMNREALAQMGDHAELIIVPGASHLFEEPGTLNEVARLAIAWFADTLPNPGLGRV